MFVCHSVCRGPCVCNARFFTCWSIHLSSPEDRLPLSGYRARGKTRALLCVVLGGGLDNRSVRLMLFRLFIAAISLKHWGLWWLWLSKVIIRSIGWMDVWFWNSTVRFDWLNVVWFYTLKLMMLLAGAVLNGAGVQSPATSVFSLAVNWRLTTANTSQYRWKTMSHMH